MPEDVAFISSKSGVDTSRDGKVMSVAKKSADRQTDGFSSLYSREYIYILVHVKLAWLILGELLIYAVLNTNLVTYLVFKFYITT